MRIVLKEPPPPVRPAIAVVAALLILLPSCALIIMRLVEGKSVPAALIVPLALFLVPVATGLRALFLKLTRKKQTGELIVSDGAVAVRLPGTEAFEAALLDLRVLRAAKVGLVIGTEARALVIPTASLAGTPARDVVTAVLERLRALEGGSGAHLAEHLEKRDEAAGAIEKRPLVVSLGVAAVCALVFALEVVAGGMTDGRVLLELGAARRDLVLEGNGLGAWRIPAAALMHGHLLHLILNATSLLVVGPVLERWLARWRYALVLLGSALAGTAASALLHTDVATVGLSGGLFGLLGALATTTLRYRKAPLVGPRLPLRSWVILLIANGVLTAAPGVDAWAHVGGALAGALIAVPLTPSIRAAADGSGFERVPSLVKERGARVAAIVVLAICAVGVAGIVRAFVAAVTAT